jgi:hypothetical protein
MNIPFRRLAALIGVGAVSVNLSGCIVAAVPLIMAAGAGAVAVAGFAVYKTVQTSGGGSLQIGFGSADPKHPAPPPPLPDVNSVAVWPGNQRDETFANALKVAKLTVKPIPGAGALPTAEADQLAAFAAKCPSLKVDVIFASFELGQTVNSSMMKRSSVTDKIRIEGYGCRDRKIVWSDAMAIVITAGKEPTPQSEIDTAAGQAWAERVLQARGPG